MAAQQEVLAMQEAELQGAMPAKIADAVLGGRIINLTVGRITLMFESLIECLGCSIETASSFLSLIHI